MTTVRLNTPSKSVVKLGGFSYVEACEHDCDQYFHEADSARDHADGINFNWANMRRSLAALTEAECRDMKNNPWACMGAWWQGHQQERHEATSGRLRITHMENTEWKGWITQDQLEGRMVPPGRWTQLVEEKEDGGRRIWMTDTPVEVADQMEFYDVAHGRVLINGLGLGMMQEWILKDKPCVVHLDIVERDPDIINLIAPYFEPYGERVTIHHADAYKMEWPPGTEWDVVYHDIWPDISAGNLDGMKQLMKKYGGRALWQGCWARKQCEGLARKEARFTKQVQRMRSRA